VIYSERQIDVSKLLSAFETMRTRLLKPTFANIRFEIYKPMVTIRTTLFKIKKLRLFIVVEITNAMHGICTTALFYTLAPTAIFRELLDPSELHENTDRYGRLSYNVG
jgi:hypothetical protein